MSSLRYLIPFAELLMTAGLLFWASRLLFSYRSSLQQFSNAGIDTEAREAATQNTEFYRWTTLVVSFLSFMPAGLAAAELIKKNQFVGNAYFIRAYCRCFCCFDQAAV